MLVFGILTSDRIHGAFYKEMYGHLAGLKKKNDRNKKWPYYHGGCKAGFHCI